MNVVPRTIAVTGPLGFVASRLLPRFAERGDRVLAIVRPGRAADALTAFANVEVRRGDLATPGTLAGAFDGADAVVHLAGLALVPGMLPAMLDAGVGGGVFVSSAGVYTKLASRGADAKRAGEAALATSPLTWTVLRPSMIYGTPRDRNLVRALRWFARFPVMPVPDGGRTLQQPVHVDDLVQAILAALDRPAAARRAFDVGGPRALPLAEVLRECAASLGRPCLLLPVPLGPAHALAGLARRARLPFPVRPEQVLRLAESKAVDIEPARSVLGFAPRDFRDGIRAEAALVRAGEA